MDEITILTMLLAFALGWWGGKIYYKKNHFAEYGDNIRKGYCKGLNYFLNEKPEKAIEIFENLLANDAVTIDTHLALGNLFRRRGEVERAIKIHEELISGTALTTDQKHTVHFELGLDYLRAGLYDRAEIILSTLIDDQKYQRISLEMLLHIYQQEKDWQKAKACVATLTRYNKPKKGETEALFLCELATEALREAKSEMVVQLLTEELNSDPNCVRALLMKADFLSQKGRYGDSIKLLKEIEYKNPAFLPEIIPLLSQAHRGLGSPEPDLINYFDALYRKYRLPQLAVVAVDLIASENGKDAALRYLMEVVDEKAPSLSLLHASIKHRVTTEDAQNSINEMYRFLEKSLDQLLRLQPKYRCSQCGFSGEQMHWRCPSCNQWESTLPLSSEYFSHLPQRSAANS